MWIEATKAQANDFEARKCTLGAKALVDAYKNEIAGSTAIESVKVVCAFPVDTPSILSPYP
jgi:hypothetical protein